VQTAGVRTATRVNTPALAGALPYTLCVEADRDVDWEQLRADLHARGMQPEIVLADDVLGNLREMTATVARNAQALARDREQWEQFAASDRDARVQRALLAHVEHVLAAGRHAGDPRMAEIAALATAEREFWSAVAPLPAPATPELEATRSTQALLATTPIDATTAQWRVTTGFRRWVVARLAWDRIGSVCDTIATDALRKAARTGKDEVAANHREFARRCADLRDAIARMLAP
jgi:hypothetical protein